MDVVIFGGSGFIGQKIAKELVTRGHHVVSFSRHGKPQELTEVWSKQVQWVHSDILTDTDWQLYVDDADWVIDTIGIIFENRRKNKTYHRFILMPVEKILAYLKTSTHQPRLLFISANNTALPLRRYMDAKFQAEQLILEHAKQNVVFYPSLVTGAERPNAELLGSLINFTKKIPLFNRLVRGYDPISNDRLAIEIVNVMEGKTSIYTKRRQD